MSFLAPLIYAVSFVRLIHFKKDLGWRKRQSDAQFSREKMHNRWKKKSEVVWEEDEISILSRTSNVISLWAYLPT